MAQTLSGKTVAILATDGVELVELTEPMKALKEAGASEGDRILVGKFEFAWSNDHREKTLYTTWKERRDEKPGTQQGSRHWPHAM